MTNKFKKTLAVGSVVVLSSGLITVNAATTTKNLIAEYNNIKVTYDGVTQAPTNEPFLINGSVYVGLRDAGQMTNNNVAWDGTTKTVNITSKPDDSVVDAEELAKKNLEIAALNNEIEDLEEKIAALEAQIKVQEEEEQQAEEEQQQAEDQLAAIDDKALDSMMDDLDDDYDKEYSVGWFFDLDFDTKNEEFELEVSYESDDDADDFNDISVANLERFLTSICEDIQKEFGEFPIQGELLDYSEGDTVIDFNFDEDEEFSMTRYYPLSLVEAFEKDLEDEFADLVNENAPEALADLDIDYILIEENEDNYEELTFHVYTTLSASDAEAWNAAETDAQYMRTLENNMKDLNATISKFFNTDELDGYILASDGDRLASFEDRDLDFDEYDPN